MNRNLATLDPEYKKAYTRGWTASNRATGSSCLDQADARNEPDAWYDGYFDAGAGREKWHLAFCTQHHNDEGGCGRA